MKFLNVYVNCECVVLAIAIIIRTSDLHVASVYIFNLIQVVIGLCSMYGPVQLSDEQRLSGNMTIYNVRRQF